MKPNETEFVEVPPSLIGLADRRTSAFLRFIGHPDGLRTVIRSAYAQGLEDGYRAALRQIVAPPVEAGE